MYESPYCSVDLDWILVMRCRLEVCVCWVPLGREMESSCSVVYNQDIQQLPCVVLFQFLSKFYVISIVP